MVETTSITVPKTMTLSERLSEVNKRLLQWIESLERPFDDETDSFQLSRCEATDDGYSYHYVINRDAKISARVASARYKAEGLA
jgi:hypothetical protein